jgi:hypothetical protein
MNGAPTRMRSDRLRSSGGPLPITVGYAYDPPWSRTGRGTVDFSAQQQRERAAMRDAAMMRRGELHREYHSNPGAPPPLAARYGEHLEFTDDRILCLPEMSSLQVRLPGDTRGSRRRRDRSFGCGRH